MLENCINMVFVRQWIILLYKNNGSSKKYRKIVKTGKNVALSQGVSPKLGVSSVLAKQREFQK